MPGCRRCRSRPVWSGHSSGGQLAFWVYCRPTESPCSSIDPAKPSKCQPVMSALRPKADI
jgi:hypothetical protein